MERFERLDGVVSIDNYDVSCVASLFIQGFLTERRSDLTGLNAYLYDMHQEDSMYSHVDVSVGSRGNDVTLGIYFLHDHINLISAPAGRRSRIISVFTYSDYDNFSYVFNAVRDEIFSFIKCYDPDDYERLHCPDCDCIC